MQILLEQFGKLDWLGMFSIFGSKTVISNQKQDAFYALVDDYINIQR
jgi:hypothetical protein